MRKPKPVPPAEWKWFGHAAHFICSDRCRFHLVTTVGKTLVSTVGDLHLTREGPIEPIGYRCFYETAITKKWKTCCDKRCKCGGQPMGSDWCIVGCYQTAAEAQAGHMTECAKAAGEPSRV